MNVCPWCHEPFDGRPNKIFCSQSHGEMYNRKFSTTRKKGVQMKPCITCKIEKDESEFYHNSRTSDKLQCECKSCQMDRQRERRAKERESRPERTGRRHVHTHADYLHGECLKCRNARRWAAYKKYGHPIMCKSGREVPSASFGRA